jgi:hypothetical protein
MPVPTALTLLAVGKHTGDQMHTKPSRFEHITSSTRQTTAATTIHASLLELLAIQLWVQEQRTCVLHAAAQQGDPAVLPQPASCMHTALL